MGYSLWCRKDLGTTEGLGTAQDMSHRLKALIGSYLLGE